MKRVASLALVAALASCGGGGSTVPASGVGGAGGVSGPASQVRTAVTFTLKSPASSSATAVRRSQYISPSTQSLVVTLTSQNGTAITSPQAYAANVTPSACPSVSGTETCTLAVPASVGADVFTVATYDATQASATPATLTGHLLSTASVTKTVVAGTANSVVLTLDGVVASVSLALSNAAPPTGTAATIGLTVTAEDADGNIIVGPGTYATPITLADSDTTGVTSLSTTSVTGPSTAVTVAYNGNTVNATFTATAPSVSTATATLASAIGKIYTGNYTTNQIVAFTPTGVVSPPTISNGLDGPDGIATDVSGNLYAANYNSNTVTKDSPAGTLLMTISTGVNGPTGVAVDASGKIYVANTNSNAITTYTANGTQTPLTITTGVNEPEALTVDASGNIYVANATTVTIYDANGSLKQTLSVGSGGPSAVAVDANGKIYVETFGSVPGAGTVITYTSTGAPTTPTISGLDDPDGIAIDFAGNIYVSEYQSQSIATYSASGSLVSSFPATYPSGIAIF